MQELFSTFARVENPTIEMVLFTFLLAFICSVSIALTYFFTTPSNFKTANYIQALILSSIISTMILQSIGDNVASGLGILGALTIINFRTSFRDPRDIIFMFASLGVGIACGSYVFPIAITGTAFFCVLALILKFTNFSLGNHSIWILRIRLKDESMVTQVESILNNYCRRYAMEGFRNSLSNNELLQDRDYLVVLKIEIQQHLLVKDLSSIGVEVRRFINQNSETSEL